MKKNFIYNFLLTGSNLLFPLLTFPYLSRIIGARGLGINNFILSYCQNFIILAALGLPVYGIREIARVGSSKEKRSKLFFELLVIHLLLTLALLIVYFISILFYKDFQNYRLLIYAGGILILSNAFTCEWLFTGVSDFKYITLRSIAIKAIALIAIFTLVNQKDDFTIYFIIYVVQTVITAIINLNYAKKYITKNIKFKLSNALSHVKPLSMLGFYIVLTSLYTTLPNILLGVLSSKTAVGYFYGSDKIIRMIISFFGALSMVMIPKLNSLVEEENSLEYKLLIQKSLHITISLGVPISVFIFLMARPLVLLLAGDEFLNSVACVQIMAPIVLIVAFAQVYCLQILSVHRKDSLLVKLAAIGMVVSILINLISIHHYAERATAFSQLISELIVTVFAFFWAKTTNNSNFPARLFLYNILFTIPFIPITSLLSETSENNFVKLILSAFFCGIYFIFYQFFVLKNEFLLKTVQAYWMKLKLSFNRG